MAYYPPTPSFGLPFSLAQQNQMSTSSRHQSHNPVNEPLPVTSNMEPLAPVVPSGPDQHPVNQETSSKPSSTFSPPTLNALNAFQRNAALPEINSQAFGHPAPPPLPIFGQFANGALPPPPYPPVPIPQNGFSTYSPSVFSGNRYQSFIPPPPPHSASTRSPNPPLKLVPPKNSRSHQHLSVGPDREEGELSDVELGQPLAIEAASPRRTESATGNYKGPANGSSTRGTYVDLPRHVDSSRDTRPETRPRSSMGQEASRRHWSPRPQQSHRQLADKWSPVTSPRIESYTSSRRRTPDRYVPNPRPSIIRNTHAGDKVRNQQRKASVSNQSNPPPTARSATETRVSAKHALLNLFPHKIRFEDIAAEGIDEELLRDLYEEVGIKIPSQSLRRHFGDQIGEGSPTETAPVSNGTLDNVISVSGKRQTPRRSLPRQRQETDTVQPKPQELLEQPSTAAESTNSNRPVLGKKGLKVLKNPGSATSKELRISPAVGRGSSVQTPPSTAVSPPLERKDKIARLLAAKNVKMQPTPVGQKDLAAGHVDAVPIRQSQKDATSPVGGAVHSFTASPDGFVDIDSISELPKEVSGNSQRVADVGKLGETESARQRAMAPQNGTIPQEPQPKIQTKPPTVTPETLEKRLSSDVPKPLGVIKHTILDSPPAEQPNTETITSVRRSRDTIPQPVKVGSTPFSGIPGLFLSSPIVAPGVSHAHPSTPAEKHAPFEEIVNRRKRPVASDFNPGPISSTGSWKRPFGRSRTDQVIIEVSDDETVDEVGDNRMEFEYGTQQPTFQAHIAQTNLKPVATRDLPPLIDFPSRKPFSAATSSAPISALNTPPISQKSASSKDPDSLKRTEATIEEMRRKIAAMEQRARAKGSTSRAQTPATPGRVPVAPGIASSPAVSASTIEPSSGLEPSIGEPPQKPEARPVEATQSASAEQKGDTRAKETENAAAAVVAAAAKAKAEDIAKVRAAALNRLRMAKLEKARNLALEKEKVQEQDEAKAAAVEQQKAREQEKVKLAAAEEQRTQEMERVRLEAQEKQRAEEAERAEAEAAEKQKAEELARDRAVALEKEKKAQELERARAAVVQRRKAAELEKARATAAEKVRVAEIEERKVDQLKKAQDAALAKQKADFEARAKTEAIEQKRQRRAAIETGLPLLDAQVAKQKERLELLRKEMQEAEEDFQKGLEERRALVNEMESLGIVTEGRSTAALQAQRAEILELRGTGTGRIPVMNEAVPHETKTEDPVISTEEPPLIPSSDQSEHHSAQENDIGSSGIAELANTVQGTGEISIPDTTEQDKPNLAEAEDVMDISDSSAEEGEITTDEWQDLTIIQQAKEDVPKSMQGGSGGAAIGNGVKSSSQSSDTSMEDDYVPGPARLASVDSLNQRQRGEDSETLEAAPVIPMQASAQEEGEIDSRSVSMDDSDEYEPPEATPPLVRAETSILSSPFSPASADAIPLTGNNPSVISDPLVQTNNLVSEPYQEASTLTTSNSAIPQPIDAKSPLATRKHFVPYESPLKQFRSFRYHPCFTDVVSGGFRSLTYSHNINESNPVCRYEAAGGICNDSTCDSQHFRDMGLSDDMILVQMGSVQEGRTPDEVKQYIAGLKRIIQEMRGRKVNDFNTVASEIAAYRSRFLGDKSRVLPL